MHEQSIIDDIVDRFDAKDCNIKVISLVCKEDIERSIAKLVLYQKIDSIKIDTSNRSVQNIVNEIMSINC